MSDTGPDLKTRYVVLRRSGGVCERCRASMAVDVHHRRARGSGGSTAPGINSPANLVHLCRVCHEWVESHFTEALATGWKINLLQEPSSAVKVIATQADGTEVLFDEGGFKWVRVEAGDHEPTMWF